ncbi:HlyC/CorC family transporter [Chromohalobacter beijerinckii]|uniref:Magnesium and cobalt efflux protein CorC n=2 Tax=Chromohalobacter TaxID=42054 RepID=A0A9X3AX28_9GAMM|nr:MULTISPECIES: HlyC/CorC family transporter [Chromohalobacter]NWO10609.1 HlyC/CorC family transporter [Chromohalobacter salexigens]CDQ34661.1 Magnesium and cobalt efflux protein CorC [Virgibacillus halodenitrificans]MCK0765658.1 HlyC/CorC family transporter [Chromohalobacter beijerinckii]MCK2045716.1 HlyC/CorC family transporter [Chromohalobacter moromii]MCT8504626.1 HlyC/CorC family transporter [Chromohalobacter moromii]
MSDDLPLGLLLTLLLVLICLSAFFSSSETGMMSINRYRLSHQANSGERTAKRVLRLLSRPDRLIGVILIGNNFVNNLAASIATIIAIHFFGDVSGPAISTAVLTIVILIFAEVTPKTFAAVKPERIAYPASLALEPLLKLFYPLVWLVNAISNGLLRLLGVKDIDGSADNLTRDELRTVVHEAGTMIPRRHQSMLLSILDLENVTVNDIMVPRQEIAGIDLDDDLEAILAQIRSSQHTRVPVYKGDINNIIGILHLRNAARFLSKPEVTKAAIVQEAREPYFIPESTPLHTQLLNFQQQKRRIGIVVDEYGDVEGLATLEDILEEIVGEFTTDEAATHREIHPQEDGSYIIEGTTNIRDINKVLAWQLPTDGPKTLNGLMLEHLEAFPDAPACLQLGAIRMEILQIKDNLITSARCWQSARRARVLG